MTRDETRQIREHALEDTELKATARLLLSLIIDWHHKEKGCVLHDSTMAEKLGLSKRTIMRRRRDLIEADYLKVVHGAHRRELVPQSPCSSVISGDTHVNGGDTRDENHDTHDTKGGDTDVVDMRNKYPEGVSEGAPAHEDGEEEDTDAPVPIEKAIEIGEMVGVSERLCREWWLYYDEKGWPNDVKKVSSALRRWKMNDSKYDSGGGGGDGAPSGGKSHTERFGDKDVVHFGQHT